MSRRSSGANKRKTPHILKTEFEFADTSSTRTRRSIIPPDPIAPDESSSSTEIDDNSSSSGMVMNMAGVSGSASGRPSRKRKQQLSSDLKGEPESDSNEQRLEYQINDPEMEVKLQKIAFMRASINYLLGKFGIDPIRFRLKCNLQLLLTVYEANKQKAGVKIPAHAKRKKVEE